MVCESDMVPNGTSTSRLNPCFNGIWSASFRVAPRRPNSRVLILVLMEYGLRVWHLKGSMMIMECLNPCFNGIWSARQGTSSQVTIKGVLILVLMEYGLRELLCSHRRRGVGLNPCFNGIWSASNTLMEEIGKNDIRLNPCFNGIWSASR